MLKMLVLTVTVATAGWALASTGAPASDGGDCCTPTTPISFAAPTTRPADSYPLEVCPVSGEKLGNMGDPIVKKIDGRTVKFCCAGCVDKFEKDPGAWHKKMDAMIIEAGKADYPLDECVVSGEELGSMGEPINLVHRPTNTLVRLCCQGCVKAYEKNPKEYVETVKAAQAKIDAEAENDSADQQ